MDKDELKQKYSMRFIAAQYGMQPNRAGFVRCLFHNEKTASMKIYENSYYCFGCGEGGDIFDFIAKVDGLSFKEAFLSLGGTYEHETNQDKLARYHAKKEREMRLKQAELIQTRRKLNNDLISVYREWHQRSKPLSQTWADCYNALQYQLYIQETLNEPR